jgi:flagellar hook-associated protein 1 FlgK
MIEFQKSFDASARLVRTADEMMDTVLKLKPL